MIDLHIHSGHSLDGQLRPKDIVDKSVESGLTYISITDHNNCDAYEEISKYAQDKGLFLIPGIEIDCHYKDFPFHLLAYGISANKQDLKDLCNRQYDLEVKASKQRVLKAQDLGFDISLGDFSSMAVITPEAIAEVLLKKEDYLNHPLLSPYRKNGPRGDNPLVNFYWDYYAKGKVCYVKLDYPQIEVVLDLIHRLGGIGVIAHPGATFRDHSQIIGTLIDLGVDGIEVFSSYHSTTDIDYYYALAQEHDLIMTAGSDFHGHIKPSIQLGAIEYAGYYADFIQQFKKRLLSL